MPDFDLFMSVSSGSCSYPDNSLEFPKELDRSNVPVVGIGYCGGKKAALSRIDSLLISDTFFLLSKQKRWIRGLSRTENESSGVITYEKEKTEVPILETWLQ